MIRSVLLERALFAALAAFVLTAPAALPGQQAETAGAGLHVVTPALEKALGQPRYFSTEDPATKFERSRRRWRKAWIGSVAAFAAANLFDLHSSAGKMELNPLLRSADGRFSTGRAAAVKGGIGAAFIALQGWIIHRSPERNYYKHFTFANAAASGGLGALAARNYGVPRAAPRP
jgi:hypothetical protein